MLTRKRSVENKAQKIGTVLEPETFGLLFCMKYCFNYELKAAGTSSCSGLAGLYAILVVIISWTYDCPMCQNMVQKNARM